MDQVKLLANRSGQALTEYILLLTIVVGLYVALVQALQGSSVMSALKKPLTQDFAYVYRYGYVKARGQDDGGPSFIALYHEDGTNFRIFINPPISQ